MKTSRANKGQFSIIAALLVSVILVTAVISTYTMVRNAPLQDSPKVLTAIGEMNTDIKTILDFTVGYYGSILKVTGNSTYAKGLTTSYLSSGLVNIAHSHPEWNPSFSLNSEHVSTRWFMPESYSMGSISVTYSLAALGIEGVKYETSSVLHVNMLESDLGVARIRVTRDDAEPELGLSEENFWFYKYNYDDSTWTLVNPADLIISSDGVYNVTLPSGIDQNAYSVQVNDNRGLVVTAFYSQDSVASGLGIPHYTYTFDWDATGMLDIYDDLSTDTFAIEVLQNGTLKWLGQPLDLTPQERPIPPISVKALRVNATTTAGINQEIPFQVEDWASDYKIPLGLAGNDGLFNNNNMLVFLVNNEISKVTLWWDGNDVATQTSYAWENVYFNDDPSSGTLDNGFLHLDVHNFYVSSRVKGESDSYRTDFLRVNDEMPDYGAEPAYVIYNGVVRDIVQQEPEYGGGGVAGSPNFYSQVFLTLPANAPYYTFGVRTIFVNSLQPRTVDDLSVIQLSDLTGTPLTEDGTDSGYPETSTSTGLFYDGSPTGWDHHWSQNVDLLRIVFINSESFEGTWPPTGWTKTGGWNKESDSAYHGSYSADCDGQSGLSYLTTPNLDTSDASTIYVDFWYRDGGCENNELLLQYYNGNSWNTIYDLGSTSSDQWQHYQEEVTNSQYLKSNFKIRWTSNTNQGNDNAWIDLVTISKKASILGNAGAGLMFTDTDNQNLYIFDSIASGNTGALNVVSSSIEYNPVERYDADFTYPLDLTWYGAVVTFDGEPIYRSSDDFGLWVMVEHPPTVTVE